MPGRKLHHLMGEVKPNRSPIAVNQQRFFLRLGKRVRELRRKRGHSQEDMISYGFSARHWQQIEAGRPITVATLLRICGVFEISVERLVRGLDKGIYEKTKSPTANLRVAFF
jgi:transcriptional regulator with XRE-family HTH domain